MSQIEAPRINYSLIALKIITLNPNVTLKDSPWIKAVDAGNIDAIRKAGVFSRKISWLADVLSKISRKK